MFLVSALKNIHVISLKKASGRFSFHFREVYRKCIEYIIRKILNSDEGDFQILMKSGMFQEKFSGSFQGVSLKIREGSHVWKKLGMVDLTFYFVKIFYIEIAFF